MDGVEDFDAAGFRLASGEAVAMDPQTRIALEQTQVHNATISLGNLGSQQSPVRSRHLVTLLRVCCELHRC